MVRCAIRPERPAGGADLISCCSSLWRQTLSLRGPTPPGLCAGALRPVDGHGAPAPGRRRPRRKATLALVQRAAPSLALSCGQLLDVLIRRRGRRRPAPLPNRVNWMRDEPVFRASTVPFMASPWTRPAVHGAGSGNRRRCRAPPAPRRCRAAAPGRSRAPICGGRAWRGADVDRHRIAGGETLPERFVQRVFVMWFGRGGGRRDGPVGGGAGGAVHIRGPLDSG